MATRYTVTIVREKYIEASDHVIARVRYEVADYGLLQEALDAIVERATEWGWLVDDESTGDAA
jgi:hypothetical protein